jgi:pSer/pThr/pTyr-binding forkhead associated (FHA) protein
MLKLQFKDQRQPAIWLVETITSLGSDGKNHIVIKDDGIEARHAEIRKDGDTLYLSDLGSFKGTTVNGSKIDKNFQLRPGDVIRLAGTELNVIAPGNDQPQPTVAARSQWSVMALSGPLKGKSISIHGSMVFGRSSSCDIVVEDAHMSRRHAELNLKNGVLRIVDLQSSNGTCVNGTKVGEQVLQPGDKISFDHLSFLVAGPLGTAAAVDEDDEDDDEATVFRAAPIPRQQPAAKPAPKATVSAPKRDVAEVDKPSSSSSMPIIVGGLIVALVAVAVVVFMLM